MGALSCGAATRGALTHHSSRVIQGARSLGVDGRLLAVSVREAAVLSAELSAVQPVMTAAALCLLSQTYSGGGSGCSLFPGTVNTKKRTKSEQAKARCLCRSRRFQGVLYMSGLELVKIKRTDKKVP